MLLSLFTLLCAYTQYMFAITCFAAYLLLLVEILRNHRERLKSFAKSVAGILILYAPWAVVFVYQIQTQAESAHEVACHGIDHFEPHETDFELSKQMIEDVCGIEAVEYRQPRMFPVVESEIKKAGYWYNSSLNPAFIPGRYMNLSTPRTWFIKDGVMQIPSSVTPILRFPLFWLSLHNLPEKLYHVLVRRVLKKDGYFVTYFHPWEFYELKEHPEFKASFVIKRNSGSAMVKRMDNLVKMLKKEGHKFMTYKEFVELKKEI